MSWAKRVDALEAMNRRRSVLRQRLKQAEALSRDEAWATLFEYEALDHALAYGRRDETILNETGVRLDSEPLDIGPLVSSLLGAEKKLTFRRP